MYFERLLISTNSHAPFTEGELRDLSDAVGEGFTHIVIPASRDWKIVQSRFQFDCRVHIARLWEPLKDINLLPRKDYLVVWFARDPRLVCFATYYGLFL
jgi:hypothetical protein